MSWDNELHPNIRSLAARIARIERHLGIDADALAAQFNLDPPTWHDAEPFGTAPLTSGELAAGQRDA